MKCLSCAQKTHEFDFFSALCAPHKKRLYTKCLPLLRTWYKTLTPLIAVVVFRALFSLGGFKGGGVWDVVLVVRFNRRNKTLRIFPGRHHQMKEDTTTNNKA